MANKALRNSNTYLFYITLIKFNTKIHKITNIDKFLHVKFEKKSGKHFYFIFKIFYNIVTIIVALHSISMFAYMLFQMSIQLNAKITIFHVA
jgi:Na+/proline symporter